MNDVLFNYLDDFYIVYLNDILIYSDDPLEYILYVRKVLERLRNTSLEANIKKYKFNITRTKYLRFIVSINSIKVDPEKVAIIKY
jgi:hypothetical protein